MNIFPAHQKGFTIIEVVVAIGILVLALGGAMSLIILTRESENSAQNTLVATYLAQEGQEMIRYVRDSSALYGSDHFGAIATTIDPYIDSFVIDSTGKDSIESVPSGLAKDAPVLRILNGRYTYSDDPAATETLFHRLITTTYHAPAGGLPAYLDVKSEVYWDWDGKKRTYSLMSQLTDWRQ